MVTSHSKGLESESDAAETPTQQGHRPSREERLAKHKIQCQDITHLAMNTCPAGLTKNDAHNIGNQAKTHQWNPRRKWF